MSVGRDPPWKHVRQCISKIKKGKHFCVKFPEPKLKVYAIL